MFRRKFLFIVYTFTIIYAYAQCRLLCHLFLDNICCNTARTHKLQFLQILHRYILSNIIIFISQVLWRIASYLQLQIILCRIYLTLLLISLKYALLINYPCGILFYCNSLKNSTVVVNILHVAITNFIYSYIMHVINKLLLNFL